MTPTEIQRVDPSDVNSTRRTSKRFAAGLAALFLVWYVALVGVGAPDLVITELRIDPDAPFHGTMVRLEAHIENIGNDEAKGQIFVRFEVDGHPLANVVLSTNLRAGDSQIASAEWLAEEGSHTITAEADRPFDRVPELDELNNLAALEVLIPSPSDVFDRTGGATVAVAAFSDNSSSGLVSVGTGVSDKLTDRLLTAGVRAISRFELEEALRQLNLSPYSMEDLSAAARSIGVDLLVIGRVTGIDMSESMINLGALSIGTSSTEVRVSAEILDTTTGHSLTDDVYATGQHESTTELSLDMVALLELPPASDTCTGGLQTNRDAYYAGETVLIGFRNPAPAAWYSIEIYSSTGAFLQWLGWQYVPSIDCGQWVWDQRDTFGTQVSPSVYVARISDGASQVGSITFQVRPGASLFPLAEDVTVGSPTFETTTAGEAVNEAVDRLLAELIPVMEATASTLTEQTFGAESPEAFGAPVDGRIAAILPDGRVAINIGASAGVSRGDFFEILDEVEWIVRGEIVAVEVRDHVSYAVKLTDFDPQIGDLARPVAP